VLVLSGLTALLALSLPAAGLAAPGWWCLPALGIVAWPLLVLRARALSWQKERLHWSESLDACGLALAQWQPGRSFRASARWTALLGQGRADHPLAWLEQLHAVDRMHLEEGLGRLLHQAGSPPLQQALRLPAESDAGGWHWHELRLQVMKRDWRGRAQQVLASLQDIQWRRTAEERQRMSTGLFQHLHEGLAIIDPEHRLLDANPAYWALMQELLAPATLPLDEHEAPAAGRMNSLLGQLALPLEEASLRRSGHHPEALAQALAAADGHWQGLVKLRGADGLARTLRVTLSTVPEPDGPPRYRVLALSDLSQELQQRQALAQLERFDALTGLPNEQEFTRRLEQALQLSQAQGPGFMLCVARLDLDGFAAFNRSQGPLRSDQALRELAQRLRTALRQAPHWSDELARLGGDEFALLLRVQDAAEAQLALERLQQVLRQPLRVDDQHAGPLRLSASVGATLFPQDAAGAETLLRHAAHALYRVKRSGRDGVQIFDAEKRRRHEAQALALGRMQQALDDGELCLYYQPKLDLASGQVHGLEALLRWRHPQRGLLAPAAFLPTVERSGMADQLGHWVLEQALAQAARWRAQGLDLELSVNISPRHLQSPEFIARLEALLTRHAEVPPQRLVLELLESSALDDLDSAQRLLEECRRLGLRLAMDDFGTGYATLSVLKSLPLDQIKIDRSFVQTMLVNPQDMALVQSVIALAQRFGCELVAEGVESSAHALALLQAGCALGQGSGLCDPLPAEQVAPWVAGRLQAIA
jgi:diguanylate cyclase (GGDEF)-like protein